MCIRSPCAANVGRDVKWQSMATNDFEGENLAPTLRLHGVYSAPYPRSLALLSCQLTKMMRSATCVLTDGPK